MPNETKGTVLVVDDEEPVRNIAQELLRYLGYAVVPAASGEEAVRMVREGLRPDLVLLDVIMPGWSGAETLSMLREIDAELPILITTGYSDRAANEAFVKAGADGFVPKPYGISTLARALGTAAGKRLKNLK